MQSWDARVAAEEKNHASNLIYGLPSVSSSLSRLVDSYEESISPNVQQTHTHTHTDTSNNGLKNAKTRYKPRVSLLPKKLLHAATVRQRNIFLPQYK